MADTGAVTPPDDDATPQTRRRPLLIGLAGGTAALGAATVGTRIAGQLGGPGDAGARLQLSADSSQMRSLSVRLGDDLLPQEGPRAWRSTALATSTHSMVGFTWTAAGPGAPDPEIRIRSRVDGRWTPWQRAEVMHDVPDAGSAEATPTRGTHLAWIGASDGIAIQVRGRRPADLTLVLLEPARLAADRTVAERLADHTERAARAAAAPDPAMAARRRRSVPAPALLTRRDWGADESWRSGRTSYNTTIKQVHVHHSASGNTYTEDDVPALLRGFYRYHTKSLGWSDIGYNFLVDRFGRTWVGRAGGPAKAVRGAHTLGFNATSTGVCVIGNFETAAPTAAVLDAVAAVAAWKLSLYGGKPRGRVEVVSEGSDKYRTGRVATLPVIDGHRDTNATACPGKLLYAKLPAIRKKAAAIMKEAATPTITVLAEPTLYGMAVLGRAVGVSPGRYEPADATEQVAWLRDGTPIAGASGTTYAPTAEDVGTTLTAQVTVAKEGLTPLVRPLSAGLVTAATQVVVKSRPRRRRAVLRIRVKATGMPTPPTGTVTVRLRARTLTLPLDETGRTVARFPGVQAGTWPVTVEYAGAPGLIGHTMPHEVEVLPRTQPRR